MITQSDERSLLGMVASGDELSFKELFHRWHPFLTTHILRITRSPQLTQEIVQDVFLKIWLTRETLADILNFKAYLVVVSRHQALNALRKLANENRQHLHWLAISEESKASDPASFYYSLIDEAIDQLPGRQRETYLLHRHQGLTYNEIASRLNLSRETIKSHLQSAIKGITKYIKEKMDAPKH